MIDLVYVSWNRREYTQHSFRALVANTDWNHVAKLVLADDASTDGTREWLEEAAGFVGDKRLVPPGVPVTFLPAPFGGPVAAVNEYLRGHVTPSITAFAKIDNDTCVPAGWLPEMLGLLDRYPDVDLLGMRPDVGPPEPCPCAERIISYADFVDGNGLWRHRAFAGRRSPRPSQADPRRGFYSWQLAHPEVVKAWAKPDLPVFQLDGLPFEPWLELAAEYVRQGWQRGWPNAPYALSADAYWSWFTEDAVASHV